MSNLKPYPEYKDSGVEWIGEIPINWVIMKFKRIFKFQNGNGFPHNLQGNKNGDVPFLKVSDISFQGRYLENGSNYVSYEIIEENKWNIIQPYSILTAKIGEALRKNHRKINLQSCVIDNNMMALNIINKYDINFLFYILLIIDFDWYSNPGAVPSLNNSHLREDYTMIPPFKSQKDISKFLDRKTSEIDNLIDDKERLIKLLEEKRQAIITETVTKGLNPNVKMKDSGIEWIGEIPEHWETVKIKYLSNEGLVYGANESALDNIKEDWRYIRITDIDEEGNLRNDTRKSLSFDLAKEYPVTYGDILFARSGATVGKTYIHETNENACFAGYLIKYQANPKQLLPKHFYYYTQSKVYKDWVKEQLIQATIENISAEKYANLSIPLPQLQEQKDNIEFLNNYNLQHKEVKEEILIQINRLREYRESLIYEAVTGKIDLRDYKVEN